MVLPAPRWTSLRFRALIFLYCNLVCARDRVWARHHDAKDPKAPDPSPDKKSGHYRSGHDGLLGALDSLVPAKLHYHKKGHGHHSNHTDTTTNSTSQPPGAAPKAELPSVLFYSFFVSMEKSAGYALPFANKVCYMEEHHYEWLLDVVPSKEVPKRPGKGASGKHNMHMAPTWYKPGGLLRWLPKVDFLVYLDMDLVVKRRDVDFLQKWVLPDASDLQAAGAANAQAQANGSAAFKHGVGADGSPSQPAAGAASHPVSESGGVRAGDGRGAADVVLTDHNKALNNGAFVLKNSPFGHRFLMRWKKISESKFPFPFTDNGSFIETILSFIPAYAASNHACMKTGVKAGQYLDCAVRFLNRALGRFTGQSDRWLVTPDGGTIRFVAPRHGFNSHEWNGHRTGQGWDRASVFQPGGFILHTKEWVKEVPKGSERCGATLKAQLTTEAGEHLYGAWGKCDLNRGGPECTARLKPVNSRHFGAVAQQARPRAKAGALGAGLGAGAAPGPAPPPPPPPPPSSLAVGNGTAGGLDAFAPGRGRHAGKRRYAQRGRPRGGPSPSNNRKGGGGDGGGGDGGEAAGSSPDAGLDELAPLPPPPGPPPPPLRPRPPLETGGGEAGAGGNVTAGSPGGPGGGGGGLSLSNPSECVAGLVALSSIQSMNPHDRYGVVAVPKTATTSLTELMQGAGLASSCGGVLWQMGKPGVCPRAHQTSVKLSPYRFEATERGGRVKRLSHLLHSDYLEVFRAWDALGLHSGGRLRTAVVLRDPLTRLYSAYVHGKNFKMRNQVSPADHGMKNEAMKARMDRWRRFYWSYRDYNDSTLELTNRAASFEAFASIPTLPTHNQQTRMLAGVPAIVPVDPSVVSLAKAHLCRVECVGVLEDLAPLVECVSRQLTAQGKGSKGGRAGQLTLPEKNVKAGHLATGAKSSSSGKTPGAAAAVARNSWADAHLHTYAKELVAKRKN